MCSGEVSYLPLLMHQIPDSQGWREYGIYFIFILTHLSCRGTDLILFLTPCFPPHLFLYHKLRSPEGPLWLFAAIEGTGGDIHTSGYQWTLQLGYRKWVKDWKEKTLFTHLNHMPFHSTDICQKHTVCRIFWRPQGYDSTRQIRFQFTGVCVLLGEDRK